MEQDISRAGTPTEVLFPRRHRESTPASVRQDEAHVLKVGSVVAQGGERESEHPPRYSPGANGVRDYLIDDRQFNIGHLGKRSGYRRARDVR